MGSLLVFHKGAIEFQDSILRVDFISLVWIPQKQSLRQRLQYRYITGEAIPRSRSRDSVSRIVQEENPVKEFAMEIITIVFSSASVPLGTLKRSAECPSLLCLRRD